MTEKEDEPEQPVAPPAPPPTPVAGPPAEERLREYSFEKGVPKAVRKFGKALDPDLLEPGDLLLICKKKPEWISRKIQRLQGNLFSQAHARWHHAIVSGGGVEICEARLNGVVAGEFWEYMTDEYELKVRRLKDATAAERSRVAYYAATMVRTVYGFGTILSLRTYFNRNNPWKRSAFQSRGVICSQLFAEACYRIGIVLTTVPIDRISPAHLSASAEMVDVPLKWVRV